MDIIIKWKDGKKGFNFPINPASFDISESQNNTSIYIHNKGEMNLKGKRSLRTVTWSSFFPKQAYSFCQVKKPKKPKWYVDNLRSLMEKNITCQVTISGRLNMYCTIESFTYGESEKNRDISYSITFKEYRDIEKRPAKRQTRLMYVWKKGDTWAFVCQKMLGNRADWHRISQHPYNRKIVKDETLKIIKKYKKLPVSKRKSVREEDVLVGKEVLLRESG